MTNQLFQVNFVWKFNNQLIPFVSDVNCELIFNSSNKSCPFTKQSTGIKSRSNRYFRIRTVFEWKKVSLYHMKSKPFLYCCWENMIWSIFLMCMKIVCFGDCSDDCSNCWLLARCITRFKGKPLDLSFLLSGTVWIKTMWVWAKIYNKTFYFAF